MGFNLAFKGLKRNGRMETELCFPAEELGKEVVLVRGFRGETVVGCGVAAGKLWS
jgi:hypothetical protein